jgi:uncharacterized protein (DUF305 family)
MWLRPRGSAITILQEHFVRIRESQAQRWCITIGFVVMASCNEAGNRFADSTAGAMADSAATAPAAGSALATPPGSPGTGGSTAAGAADSATEMNADAMRAAPGGAVPARTPPADSNQAFLRAMSDHHQGLVVMVDSTIERLNRARTDADTLRQKQRRGRDDMMQILNTEYDDPITPAIMPSNRTMIDAVVRAPASDVDRAFYQQTVAHHREGVRMIDRYMPFLNGRPKTMATSMRAEQQREIAAVERKASGSR